MLNRKLSDMLADENIEYAAAVRLSDCDRYPACRARIPEGTKTAVMLLAPYFSGLHGGNVSLYACARDYHIYFSQLFSRLEQRLHAAFRGKAFVMKTDNTVINEVRAAAAGGLGVVGANGLLINEKYSSFVFIAEIFTDIPAEELDPDIKETPEIPHCENCGRCRRSCPSPEACLSAVTQKRAELTREEAELMRAHNTVWGCDICQLVCPHTIKMIKSNTVTPIKFFHEDIISSLSSDTVDKMSDESFFSRAYSWRGREIIKRNTGITDEKQI